MIDAFSMHTSLSNSYTDVCGRRRFASQGRCNRQPTFIEVVVSTTAEVAVVVAGPTRPESRLARVQHPGACTLGVSGGRTARPLGNLASSRACQSTTGRQAVRGRSRSNAGSGMQSSARGETTAAAAARVCTRTAVSAA